MRARDLATKGSYGLGTLLAVGALAAGLLRAEVAVAKHVIGDGPGVSYDDEGIYGAGVGEPRRLLLLGDSTASGVGAGSARFTLGAILATGVARRSGRPVQLRNVSRSGATSAQLLSQVDHGLAGGRPVDVAVIMVGANDVKERVAATDAARALGEAVHRLRAAGTEVVVGTCPDLGTIRPIPQPLRALAQRWSRELAAAQTVAVVAAGGRTVSTGDLLGPQFRQLPLELFSEDRFHPSAAGYARAAAALLPSVYDALDLVPAPASPDAGPTRPERIEPLRRAAEHAVNDPGSEVTAADVDGAARGRWARLLRRPRQAAPESTGVEPAVVSPAAPSVDAASAAVEEQPAPES